MKMERSRTKNVKVNTIVALCSQIFIMIAGFLVPRYVIREYGSEINGLTSNINSILTVVNLLQAGMVGASIYEMYKPIACGDKEMVGVIYYSSKKYFDRLSILFFLLSLLAIPQSIFKTQLDTLPVILATFIMGIDATMQFKYFCCYDVIFSAHQKRYHIDVAVSLGKIIYYGLVFASIHFHLNFLVLYLAILIGDIFRLSYLTMQFNKEYRSEIGIYSNKTDYIVKNQMSLFGSQIVQNIIEASPILAISMFWGLSYSSIVSIYLLVNNVFKSLFSAMMNALINSFGDLSSRGNKEKTIEMFRIIQVFCLSISFVFCISSTVLMKSFVELYTSSASDMVYGYNQLAVIMNMYLFSYVLFYPYNMLTVVLGLYKERLKPSIIIGIVSFGVIILSTKISFQFAYLGVSIYYFFNLLSCYNILKKSGYSTKRDIIVVGVIILMMFPVIGITCSSLGLSVDGWFVWFVNAIQTVILSIIVAAIFIFLLFKTEFHTGFNYIKQRNR